MTENVVPTNASQRSEGPYWRIRKSTSLWRGGYKIELIDNDNKTVYSKRCSHVGQNIQNLNLQKGSSVKLSSCKLSQDKQGVRSYNVSIMQETRGTGESKAISSETGIELLGKNAHNTETVQVDIQTDEQLENIKSFYDQTKTLTSLVPGMAPIPPSKDVEAILKLQNGQTYCYEDPKGLVIYRKREDGTLERYPFNSLQKNTVRTFYNATKRLTPLDLSIPSYDDICQIRYLQRGQAYCYKDADVSVIYRITSKGILARYTLSKQEMEKVVQLKQEKDSNQYDGVCAYTKDSGEDRLIPVFRIDRNMEIKKVVQTEQCFIGFVKKSELALSDKLDSMSYKGELELSERSKDKNTTNKSVASQSNFDNVTLSSKRIWIAPL